jgi:hypothetical protein
MSIRLLDDVDGQVLGDLRIEELVVRRVAAVGELLDVSHDLLLRVFETSVVDPKQVYIDAVADRTGAFRDFPPLFFAGLFADGQDEWLGGFISSDLMLIGASGDKVQLSIGNIVTSPRLRELGFRGLGTTLWKAALNEAQKEADRAVKRLAYSTAEAEPASLPFWSKLGYRWPQGVKYFQPPLEFDDEGNPEHDEVPETLLIHPLGSAASAIEVSELRAIIESLYWNWGIRPSLHTLSSAAMARAKECVMGRVLQRTFESLPESGCIPLLEVPATRAH